MATVVGRDDNHTPIQGPYACIAKKSMTLAGGTTNDPGDYDGTGNPATLFTVTGDCLVTIFGIVNTNLVGAATIEVGIAENTAALIAQSTATDIDDGHIWIDATPGTVQLLPTASILNDGTDIIQTVGSADITAGQIDYYCFYQPLEAGASVVAA